MTELDSEARALIDLARGAEDGSLEDRTRVRRKIAAVLGMGAFAVSTHEAIGSGVKASLAPLTESAPGASANALVQRASGEMLAVSTAAKSAGLLGASQAIVLHAVAFLFGGALLGGAAWLMVGGDTNPVEAREPAAVSLPSPNADDSRSAAPTSPTEQAEQAGSAETAEQLVPRPETPVVESPIQPEDLPMSPKAGSRAASSQRSAARTGTAVAASSGTGLSLAEEARDVAAVQEALREGRPTLALSRLDAMDRRPGGILGEERLVARVLSLCGLNRVAEAEAVARQVHDVAPESPLLPRLGASCAKGAVTR